MYPLHEFDKEIGGELEDSPYEVHKERGENPDKRTGDHVRRVVSAAINPPESPEEGQEPKGYACSAVAYPNGGGEGEANCGGLAGK